MLNNEDQAIMRSSAELRNAAGFEPATSDQACSTC